ncbi:hypothetical protein [Actinorhabdospora filicis]|nr:hypothetical protein [Actinorhabdospora filicis]
MSTTEIELGDLSAPPTPEAPEPRRRWLPAVAVFIALALGAAAINWALKVPQIQAYFADPVPRWTVKPAELGALFRARAVDGLVIVTAREGIAVYDAVSGAQVWTVATGGADAPWIDVVDDVLFWGVESTTVTGSGTVPVEALNLRTGRSLYRIPGLDGETSEGAVTAAGVVLKTGGWPGTQHMKVLDLHTGAERWSRDIPDGFIVLPTGVVANWQFENGVGHDRPAISEVEPDASTIAVVQAQGTRSQYVVDLNTGTLRPMAYSEFSTLWIVAGQVVTVDGYEVVCGKWRQPIDFAYADLLVPIVTDGRLLDTADGRLFDLDDGEATDFPAGAGDPVALGQGVLVRAEGMRFTGARLDGGPGWITDLGISQFDGHLTDGHKLAVSYHYGYGQRIVVIDLATGVHREYAGDSLLGYSDGALIVQRDGAVVAYGA